MSIPTVDGSRATPMPYKPYSGLIAQGGKMGFARWTAYSMPPSTASTMHGAGHLFKAAANGQDDAVTCNHNTSLC